MHSLHGRAEALLATAQAAFPALVDLMRMTNLEYPQPGGTMPAGLVGIT